jgi:hypothetical protein
MTSSISSHYRKIQSVVIRVSLDCGHELSLPPSEHVFPDRERVCKGWYDLGPDLFCTQCAEIARRETRKRVG